MRPGFVLAAIAISLLMPLASVGGAAAAPARPESPPGPTGRAGLEGTWQPRGFADTISTLDGSPIPFQPAARKRYDESLAAQAAGKPIADSSTCCLPSGVPRVMWAPYLTEIIVQPKRVLMLHEVQHLMRFIYLDEAFPAEIDPTYMGYSVGRWDGDTLVVETKGLTDDTILDRAGITHSTDLKVTERIRVLPDGNSLEDRMTFEDPKTFTKPWDTAVRWYRQAPGIRILEYVCEQNNRTLEK